MNYLYVRDIIMPKIRAEQNLANCSRYLGLPNSLLGFATAVNRVFTVSKFIMILLVNPQVGT